MKFKRMLSALLAGAMIFSLGTADALAAEVEPDEPVALEQSIDTENQADLETAEQETEPEEAEPVIEPEEAESEETEEAASETEAETGLFDESAEQSQPVYVMMNIPYNAFYAAEIQNDVEVDAFTSATMNKPANERLAGKTYHAADNSAIYGVTFPVQVPADVTLDETKLVAEADIVSAANYSYYVLSETPAMYKVLSVTDAGYSFSAVVGETNPADSVTAEITTEDSHGDYMITTHGLITQTDRSGNVTVEGFLSSSARVYAVRLTADNGKRYGLRALENIWQNELAFCVGGVTVAEGCPTSSAHYESAVGSTITSITYYTTEGIYEIPVSLKVTPKALSMKVSVADALYGTGSTTFTVEGLPEGFEADYSVADGFTVDAAAGTIAYTDAAIGSYKLTITDKSGTYAPIKASFTLYGYVMMNIPYNVFYTAEIQNDVAVDAFTSATMSKPANERLAGKTYHATDNSAIYGVTYPVKVTSLAALSSYTETTAEEISSAADYSYYMLEEVPVQYKTLVYSWRGASFSAATGSVVTADSVTAEITTEDSHGDYMITTHGLITQTDRSGNVTVEGLLSSSARVYAVRLTADNGKSYGLRALENIWQNELAFCVGGVTVAERCPTSSAHYESAVGSTITSITYYTTEGIYEIPVSLKVTPKALDAKANVKDALYGTGSTTFTVEGLPEGFEAVYSVADGFTVDAAAGTLSYTDAAVGSYKLTITDATGKYAPVTASFTLYGYVMMNIPYNDFYATEIKNDVEVDAFTSATKSKPAMANLAGSTYHAADNSAIYGVIFPVRYTSASALTNYTEVEASAITSAADYSYYKLSDEPIIYKTLTVSRTGISFSAVIGTVNAADSISVELTDNTTYGDYQLTTSGLFTMTDRQSGKVTSEGILPTNAVVYAVTLTDSEGTGYGLRALENIWQNKLAFCVGYTTASHGCPTSSAHYKSLEGRTITGITYYTSAGIYTISTELAVAASRILLSADTATVKIPDVTYTGSAAAPKVTVKVGKTTLKENQDYVLSIGGRGVDSTNVGSNIAVTIRGIGKYAGTMTATFNIVAADLKNAKVSVDPDDSKVYTGSEVRPGFVLSDGTSLTEGKDYTVIYTKNVTPGTATAVLTGIGNFTGTRKLTFKITAKPLTEDDILATLDDSELVYTGKALTPVVSVEDGSTTLVLNKDYTVSYKNNKNAGEDTATVTLKGKGYYTGTLTLNFTIHQAELGEDVSLVLGKISDQSFTGAAITPNVTAELVTSVIQKNGKVKTTTQKLKNTDYTVEYINNRNAGTAQVVVTLVNYDAYEEASFTINPVNAKKCTVKASAVYGDAEPQIIVMLGKNVLTEGVDYKVSAEELPEDYTSVNQNAVITVLSGNFNEALDIIKSFKISALHLTKANTVVEVQNETVTVLVNGTPVNSAKVTVTSRINRKGIEIYTVKAISGSGYSGSVTGIVPQT